ncbi:MAG: SprT-like domain-containing protein [Ferruginibacter sp.]
MAKQEAPLAALQAYLPEGSFEAVSAYLQQHHVHLTITRKRQSLLGDYRHAVNEKTHRISVNGNLNKYAFLITLLHELAHLFTFEKFGRRVQAHGSEWKHEFSQVLSQFLLRDIFPPDIRKVLLQSLGNPAASSCADEKLLRVLHRYDERREGMHLVEQLPEGALFAIEGGRIFRKGERVRKRYKCIEVSTGKLYLFSPVYEVRVAENR